MATTTTEFIGVRTMGRPAARYPGDAGVGPMVNAVAPDFMDRDLDNAHGFAPETRNPVSFSAPACEIWGTAELEPNPAQDHADAVRSIGQTAKTEPR